MSYRSVPAKKAIRYTEATRPDQTRTAAVPRIRTTEQPLSNLSYRDLQQRAILLGINGKQTREALEAAIAEAEK